MVEKQPLPGAYKPKYSDLRVVVVTGLKKRNVSEETRYARREKGCAIITK